MTVLVFGSGSCIRPTDESFLKDRASINEECLKILNLPFYRVGLLPGELG